MQVRKLDNISNSVIFRKSPYLLNIHNFEKYFTELLSSIVTNVANDLGM